MLNSGGSASEDADGNAQRDAQVSTPEAFAPPQKQDKGRERAGSAEEGDDNSDFFLDEENITVQK